MIPSDTKLNVEPVPEEHRTWMEPYVTQLNGFMSSVTRLLDGGFTLSNNSANDLFVARVVGGQFPVTIRVGLEGGPPTGCIVVRCVESQNRSAVICPSGVPFFEMKGDQMIIRNIPGLRVGTAYEVTLLALRESPVPVTGQPANVAGSVTDPNGWTEFPRLLNGWANWGDGLETAAYRKDPLGMVHLRGLVKSGTSGSEVWTLPEGFRPGMDQIVSVTPISDWTTYTPTWTASSVNPAIGNGSISGKWRRVGENLEGRVYVGMNSGTTFGTGNYFFSIPSGLTIAESKWPIAFNDADTDIVGVGGALDQGTASYPLHVAKKTGSTTDLALFCYTAGGTYAAFAYVTQAAPFTWASTDEIGFTYSVPITGWYPTHTLKISKEGAITHMEGPTSKFSIKTSFYAEK